MLKTIVTLATVVCLFAASAARADEGTIRKWLQS